MTSNKTRISKLEIIPQWKYRIETAIINRKFNDEDIKLVESIGTCPIGERLGINRLVYGNEYEKIEKKLIQEAIDLGYKFMATIHNQEPEQAKDVYREICKLKVILYISGSAK